MYSYLFLYSFVNSFASYGYLWIKNLQILCPIQYHRSLMIKVILTVVFIHNVILHTLLQWLRQNINQGLNLQKTHHTSSQWTSYGVSFVKILEKINIISALQFIWFCVSQDGLLIIHAYGFSRLMFSLLYIFCWRFILILSLSSDVLGNHDMKIDIEIISDLVYYLTWL